MHLRGPMNISQLAVYQVPVEAAKLRKRNSIPFSNRRRALQQDGLRSHTQESPQTAGMRRWATASGCSSVTTVTSTITLLECGAKASSTFSRLPNTTYVGPPLPCLPTPYASPMAADTWHGPGGLNSTELNCTCQQPTTDATTAQIIEHHPENALGPSPARSLDPTNDISEMRKRDAAWDRVAYYTSAAPAQATGFSFLANLGDPRQSGTFD